MKILTTIRDNHVYWASALLIVCAIFIGPGLAVPEPGFRLKTTQSIKPEGLEPPAELDEAHCVGEACLVRICQTDRTFWVMDCPAGCHTHRMGEPDTYVNCPTSHCHMFIDCKEQVTRVQCWDSGPDMGDALDDSISGIVEYSCKSGKYPDNPVEEEEGEEEVSPQPAPKPAGGGSMRCYRLKQAQELWPTKNDDFSCGIELITIPKGTEIRVAMGSEKILYNSGKDLPCVLPGVGKKPSRVVLVGPIAYEGYEGYVVIQANSIKMAEACDWKCFQSRRRLQGLIRPSGRKYY